MTRVHVRSVDDADAKEVLDAADAKRQRHEERQQAFRATMDRLRQLGGGLHFPTELRPHLVCAKRKKNENPIAEHGVTFRRDGDDCIVEAGNRIAFVSLLLEGQGEDGPQLAVVPAEAMAIIAGAEDELATLWFADCKVHILVDQAVHEFFVIQPDLPIGANLRATDSGQRSLAGVTANVVELAKIQRALACESLALRHHSRGVLACYPNGAEKAKSQHRGFLALYSTSEEQQP